MEEKYWCNTCEQKVNYKQACVGIDGMKCPDCGSELFIDEEVG